MNNLIESESIENIDKAKALLKHTNKRLNKLKKGSVFSRGHIDNEDLIILEIRKKQLQTAIKLMKKGKIKPERKIIEKKFTNGEYA